ncbi:MAG: TetR/AcrR family transcriptional regulator [Nocardia sp.]|nr:TetR/AcrR family transcriptional regulator [Nocardia sp.]
MRANAAANRERILDAAAEVFGKQGSAGSTEEVARRAKVGIGTVFRHFPTKADLIEAALLRHFEQLAGQIATNLQADGPQHALFATITMMVETGATKLSMASLLPDGSFPPAVRQASDEVRAMVAALLARAAREGNVRDDISVDEVYLLIRALAQTSALTRPDPKTLDASIQILLKGLQR